MNVKLVLYPNERFMKKYIFFFILISILCINLLQAQNTSIPDSNFEQALIDLGIDTDGMNGQVLTANISSITALNIIARNINDLTGIEDFVDLATLNCAYNSLTSINVSSNSNLESLDFSSNQISNINLNANLSLKSLSCGYNQLGNLSISTNNSLETLDCSNNQLNSLDVSSNTLLTKLICSSNQLSNLSLTNNNNLSNINCSGNQLTYIDVSTKTSLAILFCASNQLDSLNVMANDSLTFLDCSDNQIKSLDVNNNGFLTNLTCSSNQLSILDLAQNDSLQFLSCANNQLTNLDFSNNLVLQNLICTANRLTNLNVSNNIALEGLDIAFNLISDLDLSTNTSLISLNCSNNQLEILDIQNGKNDIITNFNSTSNPNLRCIKVDDPVAANNNVDWQKDDIADYSVSCIPYTYVPDDNFEAALVDDIPNDNYVPTANIENLTLLDIDSLGILDLTGIEDFVSLVTLDCSHNSIINLDMSTLVNLVNLDCSSDSLEALILNNTSNLTNLDVRNNPLLTCIQVDDVAAAIAEANWLEDNPAFYNLDCSTNKTYVPDDNFEKALIEYGYDHGGLDNYVITDSINTATNLDLSDQNILDLTGIEDFIALDSLDCSMNKLMTLDVSANVNLLKLSCFSNYLTNLEVNNNPLLIKLLCGDNNLDNIIVSANDSLQQFYCDANNLNEIELSNNIKLQSLNCNSNYITDIGIDLSANVNLTELFCSNNKLFTIDLTNQTLLENLDCANNKISLLDLSNNSNLDRLDCSNNNLSNLSLTEDTVLVSLNCNSNQISNLDFSTNPLLRSVSCNNNELTSIIVSTNDSIRELSASNNKLPLIVIDNNIYLRTLNVADNQLNSISLINNDSLRIILCSNNNLSDLDLNNNIFLNTLHCDNNQLNSLILMQNDSIIELSCSKNNLETIVLNNNLILKNLYINENQLTDLDISVNSALENVSCSNNVIVDLDFSNASDLTSLTCSYNQLSSLSVQNGNNGMLETFYSINNSNLTCIEIDDTSNIGASWEKDEIASFNENCHYSETYVPDDNFEAALSVILSDPSNNDNYIPTAGVEVLTSLDISNQSISDLTGIQDFIDLSSLIVSGNPIDSLDLSQNLNLVSLVCSNLQIDSLDLNNNIALEQLNFSNNQITEINISNLTALTSLICNANDLLSLDITFNTDLTSLNCSGNQLVSLYANNGNNTVLTIFNALSNPDLNCIEVDNPGTANAGTGVYASWQVDPDVSYGDNCHYYETYVPDDAFEQALKDMGWDDSSTEPLDDYVPTNKINFRTSLGISNKGISDLTGIEDFTDLVTLNCENNNLTSLNFSNNLYLENLLCSGNQLDSIDISSNTALRKLEVNDNLFITIDLSGNSSLETLDCSSNQLTSLSIINNTALKTINCSSNQLISVDANNGANDIITNFDLRDNPDLRCILVDDISAASGYSGWYKDVWASYKFECNDDDNDGVVDLIDLCPNTPFGDFVDVYGCSIFMLPTDNFNISTTSETCRGGNNGIVNIAAIEILNYTATLIGMEDTIIHLFTDSIEIKNVRAGTYNLCITLEEEPDYSQYYDLVITEPEDFNVISELSPEGNNVSLKLSGSNVYTINFNGLVYNTSDTEITLFLEKGKNTISIKTELECQGIYNETLFLSEDPVVYPNPFNDYFDLYLGKGNFNVDVKIYSNLGTLVWSKNHLSQNETIRINTSGLAKGVYYVSLKFETYQSTLKIIKE